MNEQHLRLDPVLGHGAGPVPADLAEGLSTDGTPLALHYDALFASLPPPPPAPRPEFDWGLVLASFQGALMDAVPLLQWFFLLYFFVFYGSFLFFNLASFLMIRRSLREQGADALRAETRHVIPISIIVPAGNDTEAAIATVHAMLQLDYPEFEVIVVSDDPQGQQQEALAHEFSLIPFPEAYGERLSGMHVKGIHASTSYPGLRLVDKEGGSRADALNAALNCARYPLYCNMGADFILRRDSLYAMERAFQRGPDVVAACATVGVANGSALQQGFMGSIRCWVALFQIVEHLRSVRFAPMFWSRINAMLITSRVFCVFRKETVLAAGAYASGALNEDMELVARIHRVSRREHKHYRISHVPDPLCWEAGPESRDSSRTRYMDEQTSLLQSLEMNRQILFNRKSGAVGWMSFPFILLFGLLGPWLEMLGYAVMALLWLSGLISGQAFWTFLLAVIGLGVLHSTSALLLNELAFPGERKFSHTLKLYGVALLENFGYRQMTAFWRVMAIVATRSPLMRTSGKGVANCSRSRITVS
ncbi:MAG: glycosyltransferase family 2 protein [Sulfuricella denitrificans]|nr:glycosyltransferase family 2 protein [Sulfuricella denitrificans]